MRRSFDLRSIVFAVTVFSFVACTSETTSSGASSGDETAGGATDPGAEDPSEPGDGDGDGESARPSGSSGGTRDAGAGTGTKTDGGACTPKRWYKDGDRDGFGLASSTVESCTQPAGYVADDSDCDDARGDVKPGATEYCDAVDSNCDKQMNGTPSEAAACTAAAGSYAGTFTIYTAEKVGQTIVNQMRCTGTTAETIDLSRRVVVSGTTTCTYSGSLGGFSRTQTGTIEGAVRLDGTFEGKLTHTFGSGMTRTFTIEGAAASGRIDVTSKGSWKPNAMSAVPWEVTITIAATKS